MEALSPPTRGLAAATAKASTQILPHIPAQTLCRARTLPPKGRLSMAFKSLAWHRRLTNQYKRSALASSQTAHSAESRRKRTTTKHILQTRIAIRGTQHRHLG